VGSTKSKGLSRSHIGRFRHLFGAIGALAIIAGPARGAAADDPPLAGATDGGVSVGHDFQVSIRSQGIRDSGGVVRLVVLDVESLTEAARDVVGGQSARLTQDVDCARRRGKTTKFVAFEGSKETGRAIERSVIAVWKAGPPDPYLQEVATRICDQPHAGAAQTPAALVEATRAQAGAGAAAAGGTPETAAPLAPPLVAGDPGASGALAAV